MLNAFFTLLISFGGIATVFWLVINGLAGIMQEYDRDTNASRFGLSLAMFLFACAAVMYVLLVMTLCYKYLP